DFLTSSTSFVISSNEISSLDFVLSFFRRSEKSDFLSLLILIKFKSAKFFKRFFAFGFRISIRIVSIRSQFYINLRNYFLFENYFQHNSYVTQRFNSIER